MERRKLEIIPITSWRICRYSRQYRRVFRNNYQGSLNDSKEFNSYKLCNTFYCDYRLSTTIDIIILCILYQHLFSIIVWYLCEDRKCNNRRSFQGKPNQQCAVVWLCSSCGYRSNCRPWSSLFLLDPTLLPATLHTSLSRTCPPVMI